MLYKSFFKKTKKFFTCSALNKFDKNTEHMVAFLEKHSISANTITFIGMLFAILGVNFLALEAYFSAFICLLLNRWCDILDGVSARRQGGSSFGMFFDLVADYFSLSLFVFGFALAVPDKNAVAAAFLLLTMIISTASLLNLRIVSKQNDKKTNPSKFRVCMRGAAENFDVTLALFLMCLIPGWFMPLALFFGIISLGKSLLFISGAYYNLVIAVRRKLRK